MDKKEKFIITGLAGQRKLTGKLRVKGAKNAVLKVLSSAPLFLNDIKLNNVPEIGDVDCLEKIISRCGIEFIRNKRGQRTVKVGKRVGSEIDVDLAQKMRASIVLTGPLLARTGRVVFPFPGGCVIGKRPIDFFLDGFSRLGAKIKKRGEVFDLIAPPNGLRGASLFLKYPSVTNTETLMMAAVLADGQTIIKNCALEPETISLGEFLIDSGARISGLGTATIVINGSKKLLRSKKIYQTPPDRIEAGSFLILAALVGKDIKIESCRSEELTALLEILQEAGLKIDIEKNSLRVSGQQSKFKAINIKTHEYPGFPTDLQAPLAVFLTQCHGQSMIFETIFENRLGYLETLHRMEAEVKILDAHRAMIFGPNKLKAQEVESPDLRAGLAYVLAGIIAKGKTIVHNVHYIDRGYEDIDNRLKEIGVKIERIEDL
ncbi:MAG TPA: UDP-N-acetylglucosamine 1-carboxyvinyltransferase [Candidatus Vogelbacteria bacterium]|nr:UDP-N-acetylglucosamine 1-carboxyvinyltransferase [Candidatus Vogelbacteria bacterium]